MVGKRRHAKGASAATNASTPPHANGGRFPSKLALHRINGPIPWAPGSIVSMGSSRDGHLCACVRESGRVDLYDVECSASSSTPSPRLIKSIPGEADASPSSVVVVDAEETQGSSNKVRVFVGAMDGTITELDTLRRQARLVCDSHGGAVWGLASIECGGSERMETGGDGPVAVHGSSFVHKIAAACDDGSVKIFGVEGDDIPGVALIKSFLPVSGRALSVAWDPRVGTGRVVSGGSDGCVHVWDEQSGREAFRINVGGVEKRDGRADSSEADEAGESSSPCVWAVKVLVDGTIVSGDSLGQVTFWDGKFGTMLAKFNTTGADVLALESSSDGAMIFASGIDPRIAVFRRTVDEGGDGSKAGGSASQSWAYLSSKQEHALDVRSLCCCGERLFSGGNDALLLSHSVGRFLKEHPRRVDPVPARPMVTRLANTPSPSPALMVASATSSAVDIWQLRGRSLLGIAHLENRRRAELTAVAMSPDGTFVAFGDIHGVQCVAIREVMDIEAELTSNPSAVPITNERNIGEAVGPSAAQPISMSMTVVDVCAKDIGEGVTHLDFLSGVNAGGPTLVVCTCDGTIKLVSGIGAGSPAIHVIRDIHDMKYKTWVKREGGKTSARREAPSIDLAKIHDASGDGGAPLMAVTVLNRIFILNLETRKLVAQVPSIPGTVAAIEFVQDGAKLVVATVAGEIGLFDTSSGDMCALPGTEEPGFHDLALDGPGMGPLLGVEATGNPNGVVVYTAHAICHFDVSKQLVDEESALARLGRRSMDKQLKFATLRAEQGRNPRVLRHENPILACTGSLSRGNELIIVEGSYDGMWSGKMAPIKRQRYGE